MSTYTAQIQRIAQVSRMVADDCESDALKLDATPFTPSGIGGTFGAMLAQIKALAIGVEILANALLEKEGAA